MMLADEKIMKTARELKSQRPQHKGYWQSGYRDMLFVILNEKDYLYWINPFQMTDTLIIQGIKTNDPVVWRYVCRNLKAPFIATLKKVTSAASLSADDWEDIFQEACVILMGNVKNGKFEERAGSTLFSYFVEIGKKTMQNAVRKKSRHHPVVEIDGSTHRLVFSPKDTPETAEEMDKEVTAEEKQTAQNEFLDRVFDSVPEDCKRIFKMFYWDHKPMDEIASIFGLRNADSAKTKKTRCMTLFKNVKDMLLKSGEFDEELIKAAAERAALRELLEDERAYCQMNDIAIAALNIDDDTSEK